MQELYGVKITERADVFKGPMGDYRASFDGAVLPQHFSSGRAAALGVQNFLKERAAAMEAGRKAQEAAEIDAQKAQDEAFLYDLSDRLGVSHFDLAELLAIAARRAVP